MRGQNSTGERADEDLIAKWKNDKHKRFAGKTAKYVTNRDELLNADMSKVDFVLGNSVLHASGLSRLSAVFFFFIILLRSRAGIFHKSHLDYRLKSDAKKQPTLPEMTSKAIQLLQKEPNGYVLFVEGGLIDKAHHLTKAKIALDETLEFSKAVQEAVALTNEEDTLIVVTSDHAHTISMAGYPERGSNILGTVNRLARDNITYTTLSYANGPKSAFLNDSSCHRVNVTNDDFGKQTLRNLFLSLTIL